MKYEINSTTYYRVSSLRTPNNITEIKDYALYGLWHLTSITIIKIPKSITSIGEYAISGCTKLATVEYPSTAETTDEHIFDGSEPMTTIKIVGSGATQTYTDNKQPWNTVMTLIQNVEFDSTITSVGNYAFKGASSLTKITWGGVKSIGDYAFTNCTGFTSLSFLKYACPSYKGVSPLNFIIAISYIGCIVIFIS